MQLEFTRPEQNLDLDSLVCIKHDLKKSFEVVLMVQKMTGEYVNIMQ
jgi:hypothetical protein